MSGKAAIGTLDYDQGLLARNREIKAYKLASRSGSCGNGFARAELPRNRLSRGVRPEKIQRFAFADAKPGEQRRNRVPTLYSILVKEAMRIGGCDGSSRGRKPLDDGLYLGNRARVVGRDRERRHDAKCRNRSKGRSGAAMAAQPVDHGA